MSAKAKTLTPKLRFREFRDGEAWKSEPMDELYAFMRNNALSRDKLNYVRGSVKNIHYGDIHTKFPAMFDVTRETVPFVNETEEVPPPDSEDYCVEGDLIFADASEDTNDVGKSIEIIRLNGERLLSGQHTILARRKDERIILGFGGHLFRSGHIQSQIQKEAQGTKVYAISPTRLGNIEVPYPGDTAEQQKIADCLTSLDEVIAAQGRKVEALEAHKKGLMQQLFPRAPEGETLPRLRFPEFRDAGEWDVHPLSKIADNLDSMRVPITEKDRTYGEVPYYGASGIVDYVEGFIFDEDLLCVSEDGANLVTRTYPIAFSISVKNWVNNHAHLLRFQQAATQKLVEVYLNATGLRDFITGMAQPKLNRGMLDTIPIPLPEPAEQQRIADCLGSLDARLAAEAEKLAAFRGHKKGLMQQLFPSAEGL